MTEREYKIDVLDLPQGKTLPLLKLLLASLGLDVYCIERRHPERATPVKTYTLRRTESYKLPVRVEEIS